MKINKNIFFAMGFMALCHPVQARASQPNPLMLLPQEAFNAQAEYMSFKDLRGLAEGSKEGLRRVKNYFQYKEGLFKGVKCPVITKKWIIDNGQKEHKKGLSSFVPSDRSEPGDYQRPIVEIDGVRWAFESHLKADQKLDDLPEVLLLNEENKIFDKSMPGHNVKKEGKLFERTCSYEYNSSLNGGKSSLMVLYIDLEVMDFDNFQTPSEKK
jgi:hypothetical protein